MRTADERRAANQRGSEAEDYVAELYSDEGWRVLERNLRIGGAELDLVLERAGELRFVEVKGRDAGDTFGFEVITPDKQRRLSRGATSFLQHYDDLVEQATFDVVLVRWTDEGLSAERLENAFDAV